MEPLRERPRPARLGGGAEAGGGATPPSAAPEGGAIPGAGAHPGQGPKPGGGICGISSLGAVLSRDGLALHPRILNPEARARDFPSWVRL